MRVDDGRIAQALQAVDPQPQPLSPRYRNGNGNGQDRVLTRPQAGKSVFNTKRYTPNTIVVL